MELVSLDSCGEGAAAALSPALSWKADPGDPGRQGRRVLQDTRRTLPDSPGFVETPLFEVNCPFGAEPSFVTH